MATRNVVEKTNGSTPPKTPRKARKTPASRASASHAKHAPQSELHSDLASAVQVLKQEKTRSELAAAAVVGAAAVLIEVELLPGILLGVGAMMLAKLFPGVTDQVRPLIKTTIGMGYKAMGKAQEMIAEASDHAHDMLAEIKAEAAKPGAAAKPASPIKSGVN
jgi:hypothetical protein